jgi:ADP-ribose pyrophosphatase YjhB (NUDIX family)
LSAMIRMEFPAGVFNHRIVGVVIHDSYVLLHRNIQDDFWALPGGRAELMEPSEKTIQREFREELGIDVKVERLLWIVENFFDFNHARHHELSLFYLVNLSDNKRLLNKQDEYMGIEKDETLVFRWFPLAELEDLPLYPTFLRTALRHLPSGIQHIVHYDN